MHWRSFPVKLVVGIVVIALMTNTLYLILLFNPSMLHDQVDISSTQPHTITTLPARTTDLKVFGSIIYGIYQDTGRNYILFGYQDQFIFQTELLNVSFSLVPTITYVTSFGIFIDLGHKIILFDTRGQQVQVFSNQFELHTATNLSGFGYKYCIFETSDAIYKVTAVAQVYYGITAPDTNLLVNALNIQAWHNNNENRDVSNGLGMPDFVQTISLSNSTSEPVLDMSYQQILLSNKLVVLTTNLVQNSAYHQLDLIQYSVNLKEFKAVKSTQITVATNLADQVFITSATTITSVKQVDNIHPEYIFQDLTSNNLVDYKGPLQTATFTDFQQIGSFFAVYGGGLVDNKRIVLFGLISVNSNYGRIADQINYTELQNLEVIYNIAISGTTIYISASELTQGQRTFPILVIHNAIKLTLFLDNVNSGLQLNLLSIPLMVLYVTVIYLREYRRKKTAFVGDLSYPTNDMID